MNIVNVGYDATNYYVLEQNRSRLLVDVGWPGTLPKLVATLKRKGLAVPDLHGLLVTHYHPDHAGLVQELKNLGLKHLLLEEQLAFVPRLKSYMKPGSGYVEIRVEDSLVFSVTESRSVLLQLGFSGEIVATPGHSDDSMSLVLDGGIAFVGDLTPPLAGDDLVRQSWDNLRRLNVTRFYAGHG
jgi:ribonuclease/clavin/mitogillin